MTNMSEFKRLNYFPGFFTRARDWNEGQDYHIAKRKLHNRRLHTPGILRRERQELRVEPLPVSEGEEPSDFPRVRVLPGAALDADGNEIYLGRSYPLDIRAIPAIPADGSLRTYYITIAYSETESDYVENVEMRQYSGYTRVSESPTPLVATEPPDNQMTLELARVVLESGATAVTNPQNANSPGVNEIDRTNVTYAGSLGVAERELTAMEVGGLISTMQDARGDFAALDRRFSVFSGGDVRSTATTIEIMGRIGYIRAADLPAVLSIIGRVERDVASEIAQDHPAVATTDRYTAFGDAVQEFNDALGSRDGIGDLIVLQGDVNVAARDLAEVDLPEPVAALGEDQAVESSQGEATVRLDASGSEAFDGRTISRYRWDRS